MSLRSRLERLENSPGLRPWGRNVIICPSDHPSEVPGSIEPTAAPDHFRLIVPEEHGLDPVAGLSDDQRAFLRDDDRVTILACGTDEDGQFAVGVSEPDTLTWSEVLAGRDDWWRFSD